MRNWRTERMVRDAAEAPRVSSPLELLYDLTFVVGIAASAASLHHGSAAVPKDTHS